MVSGAEIRVVQGIVVVNIYARPVAVRLLGRIVDYNDWIIVEIHILNLIEAFILLTTFILRLLFHPSISFLS